MHHLFSLRHLAVMLLLGTLLTGCMSISRFERGRLQPAPVPVTEVTFDRVKGLIVLEASVNGVKGRFLLDNGFSLSALNPDFAARAGVRFHGSVKLVDANKKSTQTGEATVDKVVIGQHAFLRTGFYAIDTRRFFPCDSLDGVIGASIINKINWQIDFNTQRLRLSPAPFTSGGQALAIAHSKNNSHLTKLTVRGRTLTCKIDFGRAGGIKLHLPRVRDVFSGEPVVPTAGIASISATGLGRADTSYRTVEGITVMHANDTLAVADRLQLSPTSKYAGYIGLGYLGHYTVTVNNSEREYWLAEPQPDTGSLKPQYGLSIYRTEGTWKVVNKNPADPALAAIPLMQPIRQLDDLPMEHFNTQCLYDTYVHEKRQQGAPLLLQLEGTATVFEVPLHQPVSQPLP